MERRIMYCWFLCVYVGMMLIEGIGSIEAHTPSKDLVITYDANGKKVDPLSLLSPYLHLKTEEKNLDFIPRQSNKSSQKAGKKKPGKKAAVLKEAHLVQTSDKEDPVRVVTMDPQDLAKLALDNQTLRLRADTKGGTIRIEFKLKTIPSIAILRHRNGIYVVFDQHYDVEQIEAPGLKNVIDYIGVIQDPDHLILNLYMNPNMIARFVPGEKTSYLQFFHNDRMGLTTEEPQPSFIKCEPGDVWPKFICSNINGKVDSFAKVKLDGLLYYVLMSNQANNGCLKEYMTDYYVIAPTYQGLAFKMIDANTTYDFKDDTLTITPKAQDPVQISQKFSALYGNFFDVDPKRDLHKEKKEIDEKMSELLMPYPLDLVLKAGWVNIELGLNQEALGLLTNHLLEYPALITNPIFRATMGMAYFLNNRPAEAMRLWDGIASDGEIYIWNKIAKSAIGFTEGLYDIVQLAPDLLPNYSPVLREEMIRKLLPACMMSDNPETIAFVSDKIDWGGSHSMQAFIAMHQASLFFDHKNYLGAEQMTQRMQLKLFRDQIEGKLLGYYEYLNTNIDLNKKYITTEEALQKFEVSRFYWRGDQLEYRILSQMIHMEQQRQNYERALKLLQDLKRLHPQRAAIDLVDTYIQNLFSTYIQQKDQPKPLNLIDTYFNFMNYMPEGKEANRILEIISKQYQRIGLLDDAAEMLNRSLRELSENKDKTNRIFEIVDLYFQNKKYDEIITILDSIPVDTTSLENKEKITLTKSKAYFENEQYEKAIALLIHSTNPSHVLMLSHIYLQQKRWKDTIALLEQLLSRIDEKKKDLEETLKAVLNNLALALVMDSKAEPLPLSQGKKTDQKTSLTKEKTMSKKAVKDASPPLSEDALVQELQHLFVNEPSPELLKALQTMRDKGHIHQDRLDELRAHYGKMMKGEALFTLLTRPPVTSLASLASVESILKDADHLVTYIQSNS